jgi:molecular chaperone DnaJ
MATDLYELLGVGRDATQDDIKRAYRRLARQLHPDANPGDVDAEARFKEVALAYEVLSDPEKRRRYDTFGMQGVGGSGAGGQDPFGFGGAGGGLGDIFEAFFGGGQSPFGGRGPSGPPRGADVEVVADLSFEESIFGCRHQVELSAAVPCTRCEATGAAPGSQSSRCEECSGAGQVRRVRQSFLGQMVTTSVCPRCGGAGELIATPCSDCAGEGRRLEPRAYTVDIPGGVDSGSTLRLSGRGAAGPRGGPPGDLYVHVRVAPHERFRREGLDLRCELPISFTQAALGAHLRFPTLDGDEDLVIPRGTPSGREFRLRGRGVPHLERRVRGDLIVQVQVAVPDDIGSEEEELLRQLAALRGDEVAPADSGFFARIRSAFR